MNERHGLLKSASLISSFTAISRILGYARDSRIAYLLGAGAEADAFNAAYRIANLLRRLVGEGAVSAAFIPVFSRYLAIGREEKGDDVWEFADAALLGLTTTLLGVTALGMLAAPEIARVFLSGFASVPGKLEMVVTLSRVMFPYALFMGLAALAMGVLHGMRRFGAPAFGPIVANVVIIGSSFLSGFFSSASMALAVGVVAGGALQVVVQIPFLAAGGWRPRWRSGISRALAHPEVRRVATRIGPMILGMGAFQINVLVSLQFASRLEQGSVTAIGLADRVVELALGSYAVAISAAALPLLAHQVAEGRIEEMKSTMGFACRMVLFVTIPAGVGLAALRGPIIEALFQHGAFDARATALTMPPLLLFALGLPAFSLVKIMAPAFYAAGEATTPVLAALTAIGGNIALNVAFGSSLGSGGPALSTSLAAYLNAGFLIVVFLRRHGDFGIRGVGRAAAAAVAASALMAVTALAVIRAPHVYEGMIVQKAAALAVAIGAGLIAYLGGSRLLGARELGELWIAVRARRRSESFE
ncbi:MAG TPA: murein biosynthesis integral membrane protein MurJ [Terriglobia bacterium]|nr:murein biosynthesis integral membrane protein MurJ [Terriglobia bacterium]